MDAAENGETDALELLLENDADVDAVDNDGDTALFEAAVNCESDVVEVLIQKGADLEAADD
jgi:ankyrin repeat protein